MIPESSDPTRDVETASRLVTNIEVAERVKAELDSPDSARKLLGKATAEPVASSNIVAVTAEAGSADEAAELANAFATQAVAEQTDAAPRRGRPDAPRAPGPTQERGGRSGGYPRADRAARAAAARPQPEHERGDQGHSAIEPLLAAPGAQHRRRAVAGLVLGIGAAFAFQVLDPRLRREEQLRRLYRLPILARIPRESRSRGDRPLGPLELSPATSEAYRTLRGTLAVSRRASGSQSHAILVTGSSPSEGKTTTAVNLSSSLATAGHNVILIEADLRRPGIGAALNLQSKYGVASVLVESIALEEALVTTPTFGSNLGILLADYEGAGSATSSPCRRPEI